MKKNTTPLIEICPINFKQFERLNHIIGNIEATLLYAKLKFHIKHTKITKFGGRCLIRSREEIAAWFDMSPKKIDTLLKLLIEKGFIKKNVSLWYGKRRLFIQDCKNADLESPINMKILIALKELTGSFKDALIYSLLIFRNAASSIKYNHKTWCAIKKETLAHWTKLSIRTLDKHINILLEKGLILKKLFSFYGKVQSHFHIPEYINNILKKNIHVKDDKETSPQICRLQQAKKGISIRIRTNDKKTNNNIEKKESFTQSQKETINFDSIHEKLTKKQIRYVKKVFYNTIKPLTISCPNQVYEEIIFSITNPTQHKGIMSFRHRVFRCLKMLKNNTWRTPLGFFNHSEHGKKLKAVKENKEKSWDKVKQEEISSASIMKKGSSSSSLTNKACEYADKLKFLLTQDAKHNPSVIDYLLNQVLKFVQQGADKSLVQSILKDVR